MNRRWQLALLAAALASGGAASAQDSGDGDGTSAVHRQTTDALYQSALESIAEGRKNDASATLMEVIEHEPLHAGAWLDLALIQCGLGHTAEAERLFSAVEQRFALSAPMRAIIADERALGCKRWQPARSATVMFGRGIDQNVNQGALTSRYVVDAPGGQVEYELSDDFRPRHDQYLQLSGEYMREATPNGTLGFAQYQFRRNDALHQYDSAALFAGLETPWRFGRWRVRGTGSLGLVTLGSQLYQRQGQLQLRVTPPLPLPEGVQFDTVASFTRNQLVTLDNFDSSTSDLRGHLSWRSSSTFASASIGWQDDHALAERPGGSRDGAYLNLLLRRRLSQGIDTELGYTRQSWRSSEAYAPGLIDTVRNQNTHMLRATVSFPLGKRHAILVEGRMVRNRENISIFQYNNRQLQVSWQWQLP